jgi:pimeloyl-ACP methyl ester carboxylesterase
MDLPHRSAVPVIDSPTIIFVHGLSASGRCMIPVALRLADEFAVFVPDLPGFGGSGKPAHVLDVPGHADALVEWMALTGIHEATFVANSVGCQIVVDLAARYPGRAHALVLCSPTIDPAQRSAPSLAARLLIDALREPWRWMPMLGRDLLRAGARRGYRTLRFALGDRIENKLPRLPMPAMVVRGEYDLLVSRRWDRGRRGLPRGICGASQTSTGTSLAHAVAELRAVQRRASPEFASG